MNELVLIFLEKVLEAIYFSMFLLIGKNIKEKRVLFVFVMIFEYLALKCFIKFNVWFQLIYTFMSYINLKVFYKEKAQITDIFLFMVASVVLIIISMVCSLIVIIINNYYFYYIMLIINRILMFLFIFVFNKQIKNEYKRFIKYWNRRNEPTPIKSLTLRNISIIIFNIMFYIINSYMIFGILTRK